MTCNSDYIMLYQNKSGVRLATRPLFLRVRTGAAHLQIAQSCSHSLLYLRETNMHGSYTQLMYGKYTLFYESPRVKGII